MGEKKPWRVALENRLRAVPRILQRGQEKFVSLAAITTLMEARSTLKPYADEASEQFNDVKAVERSIDKLEEDLLKHIVAGIPVPDDSAWDLTIGQKQKRAQWAADGVERTIHHLQTVLCDEVQKGALKLNPAQQVLLQAAIQKHVHYQTCLELASKEGWIGGVTPELVITPRPIPGSTQQTSKKPVFKGL